MISKSFVTAFAVIFCTFFVHHTVSAARKVYQSRGSWIPIGSGNGGSNSNAYTITSQEEYETAATSFYDPDEQRRYANSTTILDIKFASNFSAFNPRNPNSSFQFLETYPPLGITQDSATFLSGDDGIINMVSVPFDHWLPQSFGAAAAIQSYDASAQLKNAITVAADQILTVVLQFRCRTINTRLNKFPKAAVTKAEDDPRMATCALYVVDLNQTGLGFGIFLTNKGVWLKYSRDAIARVLLNSSYNAFDIYRRVRSRSVYEIINARVEVDRSLNETRYYVNDKLVWTVRNWGVITNSLLYDGQNKLVSYSPATPPALNGSSQAAVVPGGLTIFINNARKLDESDPNRNVQLTNSTNDNSTTGLTVDVNQYISPGLVRLTNASNFYNEDMDFYDQNSLRNSSLWGEGAISGLYSLLAQLHSVASAASTTNGGYFNYGQGDAISSYLSSQHQQQQQSQPDESYSQQQNSGDNGNGNGNGGGYDEDSGKPSSDTTITVIADQPPSSSSSSSSQRLYKRKSHHIAPDVLKKRNRPVVTNENTIQGSVGSIADIESGYVNH